MLHDEWDRRPPTTKIVMKTRVRVLDSANDNKNLRARVQPLPPDIFVVGTFAVDISDNHYPMNVVRPHRRPCRSCDLIVD